MKLIGAYFYIYVDNFLLVAEFIVQIRHVTPILTPESYLHYLLGLPPRLCVVVCTLCYLSIFFHTCFTTVSPHPPAVSSHT